MNLSLFVITAFSIVDVNGSPIINGIFFLYYYEITFINVQNIIIGKCRMQKMRKIFAI
jgi:hypothetical protein